MRNNSQNIACTAKNKSKINSKSIELPKSKLTQKHKIS